MIAEIVAVGTELLMGQIVNTNAQFISSKLPDIGINVFFHTVVGDNDERLRTTFDMALERSDVVLITGGLGPTMDDITKETVAACFGKKLVLDEKTLKRIKARFIQMGVHQMTQNNEKQAYFPEGAAIVENENGTAPGCIINENGKIVIMMPGPPSEMHPMFEEKVMPFLTQYSDYYLKSKFIRTFGMGESKLEETLKDLIETQTNPTLATYAKDGEVLLRVTARYHKIRSNGFKPGNDVHDTEVEEQDILTPVIEEINKRLGAAVYSDENEELAAVALSALSERGMTLALAESCTGGMISSRLTAIPGASDVLLASAVTYGNQAKMEILGVRKETLEQFGAVSKETAMEMVCGARKIFHSDMAVSVTGIAGPGGGTAEKPVGLVYLALADKRGIRTKCVRVVGNRARVRNAACLHAFDMIRRAVFDLPWID